VKLEKNVNDVMEKCSNDIANFNRLLFDTEVMFFLENEHIVSPIEQIFYIEFLYYTRTRFLDSFYREDYLQIVPQVKIHTYRVDFIITFFKNQEVKNSIFIECDSQQWHEKSEEERRYEKERDRFFQSNDYKIFHYTGKEIIENSFNIIREITQYLINKVVK